MIQTRQVNINEKKILKIKLTRKANNTVKARRKQGTQNEKQYNPTIKN